MQRRSLGVLAAGGLSALAATTLLAPSPASACGGFFCDNSQPVNQAAERIVFAYEDDGSVTAVIQIQYAGEADRFAWVLPVAGSPEVAVSSNAAFQRLQSATNPQYILNTTVEGSCLDDGRLAGPSAEDGTGGFADAGTAPPPGGVTVVNQGSVGPYDFVVISVDPSLTEYSDVAVAWLQDNGYQIDEAGAARLEPYLRGGMNLLAFRLTSGNDTGSIRPVVISFGPGVASIPIRPTAVAAVADMGVMVWVLGANRAVPSNYMSLELNEALINWLSPNTNYNDVVTEAANQAGGQGFVTEMAGAAAPLTDAIYATWEADQWAALRDGDWTGREGELLFQALSTFGSFDGMRDVLADNIMLPDGVSIDDVLSCPGCVLSPETADLEGFEPSAFLAAMYPNAIEPMEQARALFEQHAYMTRFYTTMSAAEMDRDPTFELNADLGDLDRTHTANRIIECSPSISQFEAPWRIELPTGDVLRGEGQTWPFAVGDAGMPANARISRVGSSGEGEVIQDNTAAIQASLRDHNATVPTVVASGCSVAAGSSKPGLAVALFGLIALGVFVARRRRS
jgi:MYXO-CTERM domain-containing protein